MLFDGWAPIGRTLVVGVLAYVGLILLLRVSGKRTLSKMNAFDFVVTVALGSTLATILLSRETSLAQGVVALALLIGLQLVLTWLSVRSPFVSQLVKAQPVLLFYRGEFLHQAMRRERVVEAEVAAAAREQGHASLEQVDAVVLETDGSMSVLTWDGDARPSALREFVQGGDRAAEGMPAGGGQPGPPR